MALALATPSQLGAAERQGPQSAQGPYIAHVFPAGGRKGTTAEVAIGGLGLEGAQAVRVTGGGVEAKILHAATDKAVSVSLTIAADAALGERDLRVLTPRGASNRFRWLVDELPEALEAEPNSRREEAQRIESLPITVNGRLLQADEDVFRFPARGGETIVCEVRARAILPYIADAVPGWAQAVLALYDASGKEIACVDDFRLQPDPVLIHSVERDGEYLVGIRDALYRGREDFVYRLRIGALPFIAHVHPLGGRRGSTAQVELRGVNLPQPSLSLPVPAGAPPVLPIGIVSGAFSSNVVPFAAGDLEEAAEAEPNDSPAQAQRLSHPATVNGRIGRPGDLDFFTLAARAGERTILEVRARRLGSPLDSILTVVDSRGRTLAKSDDAVDPEEPLLTHHADSRLDFTFPAAGDYWIRLGDVQSKGGEEYSYRLSAGPPRPDFSLRISPDTVRIAPGEAAALTAEALRRDGFGGPVELSLKGLPEGFAAQGATILAGESAVRFTVTAPPAAAPGLHFPSVEGTASIEGSAVVRDALPIEEVTQAFSYQHRVPTREILLAVMAVEPSPFTLAAVLPPGGIVDVPMGGEGRLVVKAVRREAGGGPIRIAAEIPAKGLVVKGVTIPPGKDEAVVILAPAKQAAPGMAQNLILSGSMRAGRETFAQVCPAVPFRIVEGAPPAARLHPQGSNASHPRFAVPAAGGGSDPQPPEDGSDRPAPPRKR